MMVEALLDLVIAFNISVKARKSDRRMQLLGY